MRTRAPERRAGTAQVAVLMPVFELAAFVRRALGSLFAQSLVDWELVVVDDGSSDGSAEVLAPLLRDGRCTFVRWERNRGLGTALNEALARSQAPIVAYLPADDVFYREHLGSLTALLARSPAAALAYSGIRHHGHDESDGEVPGIGLQLVQVAHRRTPDRWLERDELVTDDLGRMLWSRLHERGSFVATGKVTCEWVDHPLQRHKVIRESMGGGVNPYRRRFRVAEPLRFQSTEGFPLDEVELYRRFRERPIARAEGLKILVVGELAFNPERLLALEERGHRLFGLWTPDGVGFNSIGPLPFGHIEEVAHAEWEQELRRIQPDVIYALLNWHAIGFAHHVLSRARGAFPFVWHFKESPQAAIERGLWPRLADLQLRSDAQVYATPELHDWFELALPGSTGHGRCLVLDGDLPKADWFEGERPSLLSTLDGEVHTVCAGRPFGIYPELLGALAAHGIHTHFHGPTWGEWWKGWIAEAKRVAPNHLHLHPAVLQPDWLDVLSRYDAGWLHVFRSRNRGDLRRASWDDLNYPSRLGTYAAAGLPWLQPDHGQALVATQTLARRLGVGVFLAEVESFAAELHDREGMERRRQAMWNVRHEFAFDTHVDRLVALFRRAIARRAAPAAAPRSGHPRASVNSPAGRPAGSPPGS